MKRFTVKDFIAYNNPCFSCDNRINFKIGFVDLESKSDPSYLRPTVTSEHTEIDLVINYRNSLKLYVFHKTNKIFTNDKMALTKYLDRHKLFLSSACDRCYTQIESYFLDINVNKEFVNAVGLSTERLMVQDDDHLFQINTYFINNKSTLTADKISATKPISPLVLELPALPRYRFKNRQHFLDKMKTYLLFS